MIITCTYKETFTQEGTRTHIILLALQKELCTRTVLHLKRIVEDDATDFGLVEAASISVDCQRSIGCGVGIYMLRD